MESQKPSKPDNSMQILAAVGETLISAATAGEIAKMVTLDRYEQSELDANQPLSIIKDGNTWVVSGTYHKELEGRIVAGRQYNGPFRMVISSFDGQILSYTCLPNLPWLREVAKSGS